MERTKKIFVMALACSLVIASAIVGSASVKAQEVLQPELNKVYYLTGNTVPSTQTGGVCLPALSQGEQGDNGIYYYAMDGGQLKDMNYQASQKKWWYAYAGATIATVFAPFAWPGANSTQAIQTLQAYPVLCFEVPKSGTIQLYCAFGGSRNGCVNFFVTKNSLNEADKLTGAVNDVYTLDLVAGDKLYLHCKPVSGITQDSDFAALASYFTYTNFTVESKYISADDSRLNYLGRWSDYNNNMRISYWNAPSVEFGFTGSILAIDLAEKSSIAVDLDGVTTDYYTASGKFQVTVSGSGQHTVKIYGPNMHLKGFYLAPDSTVTRVEDKDHYVMFIGDSISASHKSFSFNAGNTAGWDWTVFAIDGMSLCNENGGYYTSTNLTGWGYYTNGYYNPDPLAGWDASMRIGMESAFFNCERPIDKLQDFTSYQFGDREPDVIVIALGVNDYLQNSAQSEHFKSTYVSFVKHIRQYYPNSQIYIMQALTDNDTQLRLASIKAAAAAVMAEDDNVRFVDDTGSWGVTISGDGTHPTTDGYATMTTKVAGLLEDIANGKDDYKPSSGNKNSSSQNSSQSSQISGQGKSPNTGDPIPLFGLILLAIASGTTATIIAIKKKVQGRG